MKVLLTSPDALIDNFLGDFFPKIIENLNNLLDNDLISAIAVVSSHADKLQFIPKRFNPIRVGFNTKQGKGFVEGLIRSNPKVISNHSDLMVLAGSEGDFRMSVNSKLLLFSPKFAKDNNPTSKAFKYGIPIESPDHLYEFFDRFMSINDRCYYELQIDSRTYLYSIISSNYYYEGDMNLKSLKKRIEYFLKKHRSKYGNLFLNYFLMSAYNKIGKLRDIDYWGVYPSSSKGSHNRDIHQLKEEARKIYKCRTKQEILIRTKDSPKRTSMSKDARLRDGCDSQFSTIKVNPYYRDRIEGKTVCIMDDFTTNGSSCETARHLLLEAGADKVIFITMGKFGSNYIKYKYKIDGDVFGKFSFKKVNYHRIVGDFYEDSNAELMNVLGDTVL